MSSQITLRSPRLMSHAWRVQEWEYRLAKIADAGPFAIRERLVALDSEWSAGRASNSAMAVVILLGTILTLTQGWVWLLLSATVGLCLLQSLFTQESWLVLVFQELGFRTKLEIEQEKFALRTLRGDFRNLPTYHQIEENRDITRLEGEGGIVAESPLYKIDSLSAAKELIGAALLGVSG